MPFYVYAPGSVQMGRLDALFPAVAAAMAYGKGASVSSEHRLLLALHYDRGISPAVLKELVDAAERRYIGDHPDIIPISRTGRVMPPPSEEGW